MKKEIKKKYKLEKKKLKKDYIKSKKQLNDIYKDSIKTYYINNDKINVVNPPKRGLLEEIGNAITHGVGSVFSVIALALMLLNSDTKIKIISSLIYFLGMFIMFTMSCLYHSFRHGSTVKRLFRRFDYSSIYLLIGATFVPILLVFVGGVFGNIFFFIQWLIIITGITFIGIFGPHKLNPLHMTLYIVLGWSGLMLLPFMYKNDIRLLYYILGGGIIYSLGIIPFALKKKVSHFIWHFFVLLGAIMQWMGIYICIF